MYAVVGLGNPGKEYENTKHNIGFITVDLLADRHGIGIGKLKHKALSGDGFISGKKVKLVKPQTFMNLSGESVSQIVDYFDIENDRLILVYDDVDIPIGTVRIRAGGSAGTHNGMRSVISRLGYDDFPRVRIGIGAERGEMPLYSWVLGGFGDEHLDAVRETVTRAADAVEAIISDGVPAAMNRYNG
ncbi:MAG: aminoacyl-tRNA hydrolase [Clostridiales Family XIII bacterium]|jgi:PTH1 family peptidyl-tRNA hydrolase|nr:aminoacyl-tRNA hydrolase [Clostridiales Family XIII bacterium]